MTITKEALLDNLKNEPVETSSEEGAPSVPFGSIIKHDTYWKAFICVLCKGFVSYIDEKIKELEDKVDVKIATEKAELQATIDAQGVEIKALQDKDTATQKRIDDLEKKVDGYHPTS